MGMTRRSEAWLQIVQAVHGIESSIEKSLSMRHGISLTEYRALQHLAAARNQELRMQDLAGRLQLNQSSVTRLVERLERLGFTMRDVCPDDKRGVYTVLTEAGRRRLAEAEPDYEDRLAEAIAEQNPFAALENLREDA
jgi:DNA-binding MarR family transcriptional regulator